MLAIYLIALLTWGWMAGQALKVPLLQQRIGELTRDAERLDTLTATLNEVQARYTQVQQMLGGAKSAVPVLAESLRQQKTDTVRRAVAPTVR